MAKKQHWSDKVKEQMRRYEANEMTGEEIIEFFQHIIGEGLVQYMPGEYDRTAKTLLAFGALKAK